MQSANLFLDIHKFQKSESGMLDFLQRSGENKRGIAGFMSFMGHSPECSLFYFLGEFASIAFGA